MAAQAARSYHHGNLRTVLLSEARSLLEEHGPAGLALREIARRVGVAAPSAYHHFANLDGLAAALAEQGFTELNGALLACPADGQGRLAQVGLAHIGWARTNPGLYRLMFGEGFRTAIEASAAIGDLRADTHDLVVGGLRKRVPGADLPAAFLFAWSLVHGLALLMIDGHAGPDAEAMIPAVFRLAAEGIPLGAEPLGGLP